MKPSKRSTILYGICALLVVGGVCFNHPGTPFVERAVAYWMGLAGAVLLAYGLVRDIYLQRSCPILPLGGTRRALRAICFESVAGWALVVSGLALQFLDWTPACRLSYAEMAIGVGLIVAAGHATRRWILILASIQDHRTIVPAWQPDESEQKKAS